MTSIFKGNSFTVSIICLLMTLSAISESVTPLMGWASWNHFDVRISEKIIKEQADAMVSSGLAAAGYNYINIDDGFFNGRYSDGSFRIDSIKFPNGMKILADYIHSKNLKAGFYSEAGENTCGCYYNKQTGGAGVGLYNHDESDINLFLKIWGFDFLKVDYCGGKRQKLDEQTRYTDIKKTIDKTSRNDINFNVCRWQFPGTWVTNNADSWRIGTDIKAKWASVVLMIDENTFLSPYVSPGHYNDMDMLEVGRGMTFEEDKSHFSMWCIMSSPLVLGNDLSKITQQTKEIITNAEVIAVNQDTTGLQATLISDNAAGLQVWAKNLNGKRSNEHAVILLNRTEKASDISFKLEDLNIIGSASMRDLWLHKNLGSFNTEFKANVPAHGAVMLKVVNKESKLQEVFEAENGWLNNFNLTKNSVKVPNQGKFVRDSIFSGLAKVVSIGKNAENYLEFRDVYSNISGNFNLRIYFSCKEEREAIISVNGSEMTLNELNSEGLVSVITIPVQLKKGYNYIRISNPDGFTPDIDKIQVDLNQINRIHK